MTDSEDRNPNLLGTNLDAPKLTIGQKMTSFLNHRHLIVSPSENRSLLALLRYFSVASHQEERTSRFASNSDKESALLGLDVDSPMKNPRSPSTTKSKTKSIPQ